MTTDGYGNSGGLDGEGPGDDRRAFLKRMAAVGFTVPVVASFSMLSSSPAFAQTLCSAGGVSDGAVGNQGSCSNVTVGKLEIDE